MKYLIAIAGFLVIPLATNAALVDGYVFPGTIVDNCPPGYACTLIESTSTIPVDIYKIPNYLLLMGIDSTTTEATTTEPAMSTTTDSTEGVLQDPPPMYRYFKVGRCCHA